jgi:hypothetical protein
MDRACDRVKLGGSPGGDIFLHGAPHVGRRALHEHPQGTLVERCPERPCDRENFLLAALEARIVTNGAEGGVDCGRRQRDGREKCELVPKQRRLVLTDASFDARGL